MIERIRAKSGAASIKLNGRHLGSAYDPVREAREWAERAAGAIRPGDVCVVLGIGSGYPMAALQELRGAERTVALEPSSDLLAAVRANAEAETALRNLNFARVACAPSPEEAIAIAASDIGDAPFRVLRHSPSFDAAPDWHGRAEALLLAREPWAFEAAVQNKPDLREILGPDFALADRSERLVSIRTVARRLLPGASGREAALWRALGELAR